MNEPRTIRELTCERCGYRWLPRTFAMPTVCPKCKSPYWNKPKKVKVKK